jgi:hypothetical protein
MAPENDDPIRSLLARRPRTQLPDDFAFAVMRRVRQQQQADERQYRVGARLVLVAYWLAACGASAWILRQGPLPEWMGAILWVLVMLLVPAGFAFVLWSRLGAPATGERG